ncbi:MAG: hypothetical protein ACFFCZ_14890 [Promethearchaeota archaeon]
MSRPISVHTTEEIINRPVLKLQETLSIPRVIFNITTTSDWMSLDLTGAETLLNLNVSVLEGENAPNLNYDLGSSRLSLGKTSFDTTLVTIEITVGVLGLEIGTKFGLTITKGDIGYSQIKVYNYNLDQPNLVSNITHWTSEEALNDFSYSLSDETLLHPSAFFSLDSTPRIPESVLAFYYPWYGNPTWNTDWNHWEDVNHDPNSINNGTRDVASTHYPSLGAYDSNDPNTVKHHIRMAQAAGIDAFIASWWGINSFEDNAMSNLLNQAAASNFHITVYFETAPYWNLDEVNAYNEILGALRYIYDNYATHPAFYTVELGTRTEPLIFLYVTWAWSVEFWQSIINQLRTEGKNMLFQGDTQDMSYLNAFDGIHDYATVMNPDLEEYYRTSSISVRVFEEYIGESKMFAANLSPGFNASEVNPSLNIVSRGGGQFFDNAWTYSTSAGADMILITSFNEWHEGTEVENSRKYKGQYLEAIKQWRQYIQPGYVFKGNLTTLNNITEAMSMFGWASLVYSDNVFLDQVNNTIKASRASYDAANYIDAYIKAREAINLILGYSSTTSGPLTIPTSADWLFPTLLGFIALTILFKRFRRRKEFRR